MDRRYFNMKKTVILSILSFLAANIMAATNVVVITRHGTGYPIPVPKEGTNWIFRGAIGCTSEGIIVTNNDIYLPPDRHPSKYGKMEVEVDGRKYTMPRPAPGEFRKFVSRGRTYTFDHDGNMVTNVEFKAASAPSSKDRLESLRKRMEEMRKDGKDVTGISNFIVRLEAHYKVTKEKAKIKAQEEETPAVAPHDPDDPSKQLMWQKARMERIKKIREAAKKRQEESKNN